MKDKLNGIQRLICDERTKKELGAFLFMDSLQSGIYKYLVDKISSRLLCLSSSVTPNKYLSKLKG